MIDKVKTGTATILFLVSLFAVVWAPPAWGQFEDQHDVTSIVSALRSPIPSTAIDQARAVDDQFMSTGQINGMKAFVITDSRLQRLDTLVNRLLIASGQNRDWVVRVLDTNPPTINAFVVGGKYIYVYTGLLSFAKSDDELAIILGHEMGHTLLKHNIRRSQDTLSNIAGLSEIIGGLAGGKKGYDKVKGVTQVVTSAYGREDEEEADALGVAIALRAGFDPLKGVGVFRRLAQLENGQRLSTKEFIKQQLYSDHPANQNRVAAITVLNDYLNAKRPLESLQQYQQSYRIMTALVQTNNILLKRTEEGASGNFKPSAQVRVGPSNSSPVRDLEEGKDEKKDKEKHQMPGDPAWLDRQRIADESQQGQRLKLDLRNFVVERQNKINAWEEKLKAMVTKAKENPNDQDARASFQEELLKYRTFVADASSEVKSRKQSVLNEFNNTVSQGLSEMNKQQMSGNDPHATLIAIIDKGTERKADVHKLDTEQSQHSEKSMAEQLKQLKDAYDQKLLTEEEYQSKRKRIMERF